MTISSTTGSVQRGMFLSTAYTIQHFDGSKITVYSLDEFDRVALALLVYRLMSEGVEALERGYDIELAGETADSLVPAPDALDALLTFLLWDRAFLSDALEEYAKSNVLSGSHIIYEHIYQHVIALFEGQWKKAISQAHRLIKAKNRLSSPQGAVTDIEAPKDSEEPEGDIC